MYFFIFAYGIIDKISFHTKIYYVIKSYKEYYKVHYKKYLYLIYVRFV